MKVLAEREAEKFLEKRGFKIVKTEFAKKKGDLKVISRRIKFPWAMKIDSKKIIHKKAAGGVFTDVKNISEAEIVFENLEKLPGFESVTIQKMEKGEQLILGIKRTPEFDQVIMVGKGGSAVEQEKDVSFRVLPIKKHDASAMLSELKFHRELVSRKVNLKKIEKSLLKLSALASKLKNMSELDINPLIVDSKNALVIDARIVLE